MVAAFNYLNRISDPYCEINCNGVTVRTSVKWAQLNPEYKETFEIDVTNPGMLFLLIFRQGIVLTIDEQMPL
jgi:Ca2+-dependent lipid-binding protein